MYTLNDLFNSTANLMKGMGVATEIIGKNSIIDSINKAIKRIIFFDGLYQYCGNLLKKEEITLINCESDYPNDCLKPIAIEVENKKTTFTKLEEILRLEKNPLIEPKEFIYTFIGNKIFLRPSPNTDDIILLYYVKVPEIISSMLDIFPLSPELFDPVVLLSALQLVNKIQDLDQNLFVKYYEQFNRYVAMLSGLDEEQVIISKLAEMAELGKITIKANEKK
ncbi:MAG: hypothetical protein QXJ06_00590 [Candidatus Aenigmatarchaeota archaeon]